MSFQMHGARVLRRCPAPHTQVLLGSLLILALTALGSLVSSRKRPQQQFFTYQWPRPAMAVDAVIVAKPSGPRQHAQVLLVKRKRPPFTGYWCLPGGFVNENERLEDAAARELLEETSVNAKDILFKQVGAFSEPGRDPRWWCISVAFAALVPSTKLSVKAADDAAEASWHDLLHIPTLAFDHKVLLRTAFRHLAQEAEVLQIAGLSDQFRKAADLLEGPWQHSKQQGKV